MTAINIHEAKMRLSQLVARAAEGEGVIIVKAGESMADTTSICSSAFGQQKRQVVLVV